MKVEASLYGDRKVFSVSAFNRGIATWLQRLPTVWVEGEVTELKRHQRWQSVFFTLKDPADGACLGVSMPRGQFDGLRLELADGDRVHAYGRPELYAARGEFNDAAAKRDVLTGIQTRFPPAHIVVAETYVQGPRAAGAVVESLRRLCEVPELDVVVVARGGGSFEDLLPFSDERLVRAIASCPVPVVSAVGHEQDTPLCDLAADVRASTPTAAARLVVPDLGELHERLDRARSGLERGARRSLELKVGRLEQAHERLRRAPALLVERRRAGLEQAAGRLRALSPRATLNRGYAIVRADEAIVRSATSVESGDRIDVEVGDGRFGARVD